MKQIIIGLCGQLSSGKGTVTKYLVEQHGAKSFRYSTIVRDVLDRLVLPQSRSNMQELSKILRQQFGDDLFAKTIAQDVSGCLDNLIVIDGVRRPMDIKYLRQIAGFVLVSVVADQQIRWQRIVARGENTDDTSKTLEQFQQDEQAEADATIVDTMAQADYSLDNNGSPEQLKQQVDKLLVTLGYGS